MPAFAAPSPLRPHVSLTTHVTSALRPARRLHARIPGRAVLPPGMTAESSPHPDTSSSSLPSSSSPTPSNLPGKWSLVCAAAVLHAMHAIAVYTVPTTLISPMRQTLGLSVSQMTMCMNVYRLFQVPLLIPFGFLLDRIGPQIPIRIGVLFVALIAPMLAFATSLPQLLLLSALNSTTKLIAGLSTLLVLISQAFPDGQRLGTASSLLISGYSLAGFVAPTVIGLLSDRFGWRVASLCLTLPFSFIALPLSFMILRERRQKRPSLMQYGAALQQRLFNWHKSDDEIDSFTATTLGLKKKEHLTVDKLEPEPLWTWRYALIFASVGLFSWTMYMISDHLLVFLVEDLHMPFAQATQYSAFMNLMSMFGKLMIGPLSDKFNRSILMIIAGAMGAIATGLMVTISPVGGLLLTSCTNRIWTYIFFYSIAYSSVYGLTTSVLPEFGTKKLGLRSNLNLMAYQVIGSIGSSLAAMTRSRSGSYLTSFLLNGMCFGLIVLTGLTKFILDKRRSTMRAALVTEGNGEVVG